MQSWQIVPLLIQLFRGPQKASVRRVCAYCKTFIQMHPENFCPSKSWQCWLFPQYLPMYSTLVAVFQFTNSIFLGVWRIQTLNRNYLCICVYTPASLAIVENHVSPCQKCSSKSWQWWLFPQHPPMYSHPGSSISVYKFNLFGCLKNSNFE